MLCATKPQYFFDVGQSSRDELPDVVHRPSICSFKCLMCGTPKQVAHLKMVRGPIWNTLLCTNALCRRKTSSPKWLCPCGVRWQSCPIHGALGFRCGFPKLDDSSISFEEIGTVAPVRKPLSLERNRPETKRKRDATSNAPTVARKSKVSRQAVPWVNRLPKLPPVLARRFGYLYRDPPAQEPLFQMPSASSSAANPSPIDTG